LDRFVAYSGLHFVAVGVCCLVVAGMAAAGRALRAEHELGLRRALGVVGLAYWLSYNLWWNRNGIDWTSGLPLQLCDINGAIAPLALWTSQRWLRAVLYFWGFALTTQAFIQPALGFGPATLLFWFFWAQHTIILGYAVFDVAAFGFRPTWRDLGKSYGAGAIYLAVVVPLNLILGADYGYLGNLAPEQIPPFVAALGPWPARAVAVVALAAIACALVELPWLFRGRGKSI
jgi:hypothetical integral membrane protein (TIGR02206 family)